jgi:hypothetical protein
LDTVPKEESVGVFAQMRFLVIFWMVLSITPSTQDSQKNVTHTQYKSTYESNISGREGPFSSETPSHTQHQDEPPPTAARPPAVLPSLSMAISAMDPNHGAAAPHEPSVGVRCLGSGSPASVPLFWAPKWHP